MKHPSKGLESTFGISKAQTLSNQIYQLKAPCLNSNWQIKKRVHAFCAWTLLRFKKSNNPMISSKYNHFDIVRHIEKEQHLLNEYWHSNMPTLFLNSLYHKLSAYSIRNILKLLNDSYTIERFPILLNDYPIFVRGIVQEFIFCTKQPPKKHQKKLSKSYSWTIPLPQTLYPQSFWQKEKNPNFVSKLEFFYAMLRQWLILIRKLWKHWFYYVFQIWYTCNIHPERFSK